MLIEEWVEEWLLVSTFCFSELWEHTVLVDGVKPFEAREPLRNVKLRKQKLYQIKIKMN